MTVEAASGHVAAPASAPSPPPVPEPRVAAIDSSYDIYLAGIGGTGIVTVNQVLATAALQQGLQSSGLDQTGLSQKAGPVTSHLRVSRDASEPANRLSEGSADCYLVFDLMVGAEPANLRRCNPAVTAAVVSTSPTPTGPMVYDPSIRYPSEQLLLGRISTACKGLISLDALSAARVLFGGTEVANLLVVGAAYQAGLLPMSGAAIESAITINGVAVAANIAAFGWGRVAVADPAAFAAATTPPPSPTSSATGSDSERWVADTALPGQTRRLAGIRAAQLCAHSGANAARRFVDLVESVAQAERLSATTRPLAARLPGACTDSWPTRTNTRSRGCSPTPRSSRPSPSRSLAPSVSRSICIRLPCAGPGWSARSGSARCGGPYCASCPRAACCGARHLTCSDIHASAASSGCLLTTTFSWSSNSDMTCRSLVRKLRPRLLRPPNLSGDTRT